MLLFFKKWESRSDGSKESNVKSSRNGRQRKRKDKKEKVIQDRKRKARWTAINRKRERRKNWKKHLSNKTDKKRDNVMLDKKKTM